MARRRYYSRSGSYKRRGPISRGYARMRNSFYRFSDRYSNYRSKYVYSVSGGKAFKLVAPITWLAGLGIGLTDFDEKIPAVAKVALANMPISGRIGGRIRSVAQGMCMGDLVQKNVIPAIKSALGSTSSTSESSSVTTVKFL